MVELKLNKTKKPFILFYLFYFLLQIFVACGCCCCGCQKLLFVVDEFGFCWITNLGVTLFVCFPLFDGFVVVDDEVAFVINGCTSVTRFFDRKTDWFGFVDDNLSVVVFVVDISFVDEIVTLFNVWILGEVVPGGINVNKDDEDVELVKICCLFTGVVLLCWGLNIYVFDVENPPFVVVVDDDDLSVNWNCKFVGGDDLPVDVTRRIDDGVVVVVVVVEIDGDECRTLFVELSRCESALKK